MTARNQSMAGGGVHAGPGPERPDALASRLSALTVALEAATADLATHSPATGAIGADTTTGGAGPAPVTASIGFSASRPSTGVLSSATDGDGESAVAVATAPIAAPATAEGERAEAVPVPPMRTELLRSGSAPSPDGSPGTNGGGSAPAGVVAFRADQATVPIGGRAAGLVTAAIGPDAAEAPADASPAGADEHEIAALRSALAERPGDEDALFRLALALHRTGQAEEARSTLVVLAAAHEERGQHGQATRIRAMLGAPRTGDLATAPNGPAPTADAAVTTQISTGMLRATAPLGTAALGTNGTGTLGLGTAPLAAGRTGALGRTAALGRAAKVPPPPLPPPFPPEALGFTVPLPGEDRLAPGLRDAIERSTDDLEAGRLQAALDACQAALNLDRTFVPLYVRIAELSTALRQRRRARAHAESLLRLVKLEGDDHQLWMVYRILLHTADNDLPNLRRLVELLIDAQQIERASFYGAKLIQLLDREGLTEEAIAYSARLWELIPGDTRAALEGAVLRVKGGDPNGAIDLWESAVAAGADATIGRASLAAIMAPIDEDEHWAMVAEAARLARERGDAAIAEAYGRTAEALPEGGLLAAGHGVLLAAVGDARARVHLAAAVGDRGASATARAVAAVALSRLAREHGSTEEHAAAVRTSLRFLEDDAIAAWSAWADLIGTVPRHATLSVELGEALRSRGDFAGAAEVLKVAHERAPHDDRVCQDLADAYVRVGQLGAALTVLDELAGHYRAIAKLEQMAAVLRQMSQLAPNNIKVKSRLIDTYLQRGFVAEARAELVQRADLEERSGLIKDTIVSLTRAADLSWTIGLADEAFALYDRVIALAPTAVEYRHGVVALYLQLGRLAEAAEHQRAIVDISLREDRRHEAIAALHQVIGLTPDDTSAYFQLGDLLSAVGEYGQAERVYRRILAISPNDAIAQAKATAMGALRERQAG